MSERMRRYRIAEVALSWVGTPFFPHMAKKGVGADCVHLALAVYQEAGCLPNGIALPNYSLDGGDHKDESIVIDWLKSSGYFNMAEVPAIGSLVTFRIGRIEHHVGVVSGKSQFIQSVRGYGVITSDLRDSTWQKRLRSVWDWVSL